jgi:L-methionine (R)-S-oxide reductase
VCGAAAATGETQLVRDVHAFPGHIACDAASRSEIVVPITIPVSATAAGAAGEEEEGRKVVAIIDVDCAAVGGFDEVDRVWLEKLAKLIADSCDWP